MSCFQVLFFGYTIACTVGAFNGMGSHAADLGPVQTVKAVKWEIAGQTFNILAIITSKSSVGVFLLRIVTRKLHIWLLWFGIFSTAFVCGTCIIVMYAQCTPLESIFDPTIPHTCHMNFTINAIFSGSKFVVSLSCKRFTNVLRLHCSNGLCICYLPLVPYMAS